VFEFCQKPDEAMAAAERFRPTVILQDLVMPGIDGLTLVESYRANPLTRDVPTIVLSSQEDPVVKADAYGLGAARIARRMAPAVDMLMVFGMDEAEVVHAAAPTTPMLVMMPTHAIEAGSPAHGMLVKGLLHLAAHDAAQVRTCVLFGWLLTGL
jgi:CheY-like chemotaxis protein